MRYAALALLMTSLLATPGTAQNPQTREGFWISFGFGVGSLGCETEDSDCDDERETGTNFFLRMGGTLSQRLLLGGEVNGWTKSEGDATFTVSNIGPVLMFYPSANGGLFLKGGLGMATASAEVGVIEVDETGVGLTIGIGYDARVGRGFALTPFFDILATSFSVGTGSNKTDISFNHVAFGLGFTWP